MDTPGFKKKEKITSFYQQKKSSNFKKSTKPEIVTRETKLDDLCLYIRELEHSGTFVAISGSSFALKDGKEWFIVYERHFTDSEYVQKGVLVCSCKTGAAARERIEALDGLTEELDVFINDEMSQYCRHCFATNQLRSKNLDTNDLLLASDNIHQLSRSPLTYAIYAEGRYGFVIKGRSNFKCLNCKSTSCSHTEAYHDWCQRNDIEEPFVASSVDVSESNFLAISSSKIPLELAQNRRTQYDESFTVLSSGCKIIPTYQTELKCLCGYTFSNNDPVQKGWKLKQTGTIYLGMTSYVDIEVYFRPTTGSCSCKQYPDGSEHFLLNIDNKHFVHHGYLMSVLYSTSEARFPLRAASRITARLHDHYSLTPTIPYHVLRRAYNVFTRLLDLNFAASFSCNQCSKMEKKTVIFDGIALGCRRDLCPEIQLPQLSPGSKIAGSTFRERLLIPNPKTRKLLTAYADPEDSAFSSNNFRDLKRLLKTECPHLAKFISKMGNNCNRIMRPFVVEWGRNAPACAIFPVAGNEILKTLLKTVQRGNFDLSQTSNRKELTILQQKVPILAKTLLACTFRGQVQKEVCDLIPVIIEAAEKPFEIAIPEPELYSDSYERPYEFFPNHPVTLGMGTYAADKGKNPEEQPCRKESQRHKILLPGIFTAFCPHEICLGFSLMMDPESPKTAFDVLLHRFETSLDKLTVVYDNACNLHHYILNREPTRFKHTQFRVDRLHYKKGHPRCSAGYNLDTYRADPLAATLNSQCCEQANADLRRLSQQLTYMTPSNLVHHTAVFLALRNRLKSKNVDNN